jgi:hypothetical protein
MKVMNMVQAINDAHDLKLQEDKGEVVYGEDVGVGRRSLSGDGSLQSNMGGKESLILRWGIWNSRERAWHGHAPDEARGRMNLTASSILR